MTRKVNKNSAEEAAALFPNLAFWCDNARGILSPFRAKSPNLISERARAAASFGGKMTPSMQSCRI